MAIQRLSESTKQFVYLERQITPREELAINALGIPGIDFQPSRGAPLPDGPPRRAGARRRRRGRARRRRRGEVLRPAPAATIPRRCACRSTCASQAVVRDELSKAMDEFQAIGACGIVMDVNTGEVLAMVSLPDYDANDFRHSAGGRPVQPRGHRHVRAGQHVQAADRLDGAGRRRRPHLGRVRRRPARSISAASPSPISRASTAGSICRRCWPTRPTSGAAHIAVDVGRRAPARLAEDDGHVRRGVPIQLPEAGLPISPVRRRTGRRSPTMTVGFGHGIAVSPLHVVRGTAAVANGGILVRPTILRRCEPARTRREGVRVMQPSTVGHHAQADAPGGDRRLRQERRGGRLLSSAARPARRRRSASTATSADARRLQRLGLHQRVPDERAALRGLHDAGRAARQQEHLRLLHRRLGGRAGGRAGDRAHRRR